MQNELYGLLVIGLIAIFSIYYKSKRSSVLETPTTALTNDVKQAIYQQIQEGNTAEAIALLEKVTPNEFVSLEGQFDRAKTNFTKGLVKFDNYIITLMQIHNSVLDLASGKPNNPTSLTKSPVPSSQLNEMLEAGEFTNALKLILPHHEKIATLLLSRLNLSEKYYAIGLITDAQFNRIKAMTKFALTEIEK